jgi:penicillin-binding protein 2
MHGEAFAAPIRRVVLTSIVLLAMAILFFRLYQLQLIYHTEFGRQSEENSIRTIVKEPIRGYMFDRNEKLMVDVGPAYGISITPAEFNTAHTKMLSLFLNIDELALQDRVNKGRIYSRFSPARVKRDLSFQTLSALEERSFLLSGISFSIESKRVYPTPARASHLLGYCKEISDAQLTRGTDYYSQGDIIGSSGLEASYETLLRGRRGYEFVSANANGQVIGAFDQGRSDIRPREGFDLYLGVDAGL